MHAPGVKNLDLTCISIKTSVLLYNQKLHNNDH